MATSKTALREKVRNLYLDKITKFLDGEGEVHAGFHKDDAVRLAQIDPHVL